MDTQRDNSILCIAKESSDIISIERTGYNGRYFVLNKDFRLLGDYRLDELDLKPLIDKLASGEIKEVVLALNPDIDGEVLSRYIADMARQYPVRITRLAHGLPVGGDIEFADEITLRRAIEGRKEF